MLLFQVKQSGELLFMDSTGNVDRHNCRVFQRLIAVPAVYVSILVPGSRFHLSDLPAARPKHKPPGQLLAFDFVHKS